MKWVWRGLLILVAVLVIAVLVFRVPDTDPAAMRAKYGAAPSQFIPVGEGRAIHVRDEGPRDAPVIVLLHGSNSDLHTWQEWADMLKADYRVIRFDQRGHGLTGPAADDDYSPEAFGADIDAVTAKLGVDTFTLAGNSMGGGIAMAYAIAKPWRLDALVLVEWADRVADCLPSSRLEIHLEILTDTTRRVTLSGNEDYTVFLENLEIHWKSRPHS